MPFEPEVGRKSAEDHKEQIEDVIEGSDVVFVTCGEGGGTGTGAAPVVANIAKKGALMVSSPVRSPSRAASCQAGTEGIEALRDVCDTLIVIPNDSLLRMGDQTSS